jgi:hypothetical protein
MNRGFRLRGSGFLARLLLAAAGFSWAASVKSDDRVQLLPRLQNGETLRYECHARLNRFVKTKSTVATMFDATPIRADFSTNLLLSIDDYHAMDRRPMMAAETQLLPDEHSVAGTLAAAPLKVSFTVGGDGSLLKAEGLDDLDPAQRLAWQFWLSQFAFGWTLPAVGVKPGEKWKSVEVEKTPSPISGLVWERETTYVQDEQCPILEDEKCAVFLTNATLKQKTSPDSTTPEDYQLHELKTSGTARGTNESVRYISHKTGLLVRASEDIQQSLDVTIAKADNTNQIRYQVDVTSHFETVIVPTAAPTAKCKGLSALAQRFVTASNLNLPGAL